MLARGTGVDRRTLRRLWLNDSFTDEYFVWGFRLILAEQRIGNSRRARQLAAMCLPHVRRPDELSPYELALLAAVWRQIYVSDSNCSGRASHLTVTGSR